MNRIFDLLMPRFIEEFIVFDSLDEPITPICTVYCLEEGEETSHYWVIGVKSFNLFGVAIFPKNSTEIMTWHEYERRYGGIKH